MEGSNQKNILLTIVVPLYNESLGVERFNNDLYKYAKKYTDNSFEIIYVNDGSTDSTLDIITSIARDESNIKIVNLSKNFGKEIATTAGIYNAKSKATMIMDGDGQHPPKIINEFLKKWREGSQVIVGVRKSNTNEGLIKKYGSKLFYKLLNSISDSKIIPSSTDYRLIDESVRKQFIKFTERNRITRGLIDWLGYKRDYVYFVAPERLAGEASYKTSKLIKLAMNSFISLSLKPLFISGYIGIILAPVALLAGIFIIIEQFILGDPMNLNITGSAMLGILIIFLVGLLLISQWFIAIYLSHVHSQTQGRPLFIIDEANSLHLDENYTK